MIALRAHVVCTSAANTAAMSCGSYRAPLYPLQSHPTHLRVNVILAMIVSWGRTVVRIRSAQRRNANRRARKEASEHVEDGDNEVAVAAAALQETSIAPVPQPAELSEEGKRIRCVCWSVGCAMSVVGMHVHECNLCQHISRVACAQSYTHALTLSHTRTHASAHARTHSHSLTSRMHDRNLKKKIKQMDELQAKVDSGNVTPSAEQLEKLVRASVCTRHCCVKVWFCFKCLRECLRGLSAPQ